MAFPSLLGINSGAALAMALTSALSPTPLACYSLAFIAAYGGVSWLLVMTAGGGFHPDQDRNKLILAGIALSALCMALTRITEDHAYGIFYWLAACLMSAGMSSGSIAGKPVESAQREQQHRPHAGGESAEATINSQYSGTAFGGSLR